MIPLHLIVAAWFGWLEREQADVIEFLREENRVLKAQLHGRRMRLNDDERRRLAVIGHRLGRRILAEVATIVTPDTRWWTSQLLLPSRRIMAGPVLGHYGLGGIADGHRQR